MPAVLDEVAYLNNPGNNQDKVFLNDLANRLRAANAIEKAIRGSSHSAIEPVDSPVRA